LVAGAAAFLVGAAGFTATAFLAGAGALASAALGAGATFFAAVFFAIAIIISLVEVHRALYVNDLA
jgi:ABC-type methionine transport system permease subunit